MNDPRKHHYVPVFYLRQWATNGFLCEMRKIRGKVIVSSKAPNGTGFQKDLYKIEGVPTDVAQQFERTFMHMVDTQAAVAMRRILMGTTDTWPTKERDAWVRFILSLIFRNPEAVTVIKAEMRRIWDESIQGVRDDYESYRRPGDPDNAEEYIARTDPNAPAIAASNFLQRMMNSRPIANGILKLRWGRITFPHSRWTLVTSDRPLDLPYGLGNKNSYLALPIGPRTLFVGTSDRLDLRGLSAAKQTEIVRHINERTVCMARQYVWAIDDGAREFVRKYIGTLPERQLISDRARQLAVRQAGGANG
jgi:hypothetical protein